MTIYLAKDFNKDFNKDYRRVDFVNPSAVVGLTCRAIVLGGDPKNPGSLTLVFTERSLVLFHSQDCCENVYLQDIAGSLWDLIGSPILEAEVVSNSERNSMRDESKTWTFYKFGTMKGRVTLRFLGESNGFYSESVDTVWVPTEEVMSEPSLKVLSQ